MADLTDQELRDARVWAANVSNQGKSPHLALVNAARVILATVDAPSPTLAEELQEIYAEMWSWTDHYETFKRVGALITHADQMEHNLAEARAEVERLTAVNEELRRTDNYREFKAFLGVQKDTESNAETPDPADVPPGEAWIAEVDGERCTAVKDGDADIPWNTVDPDGYCFAEDNGDVTLVAHLVPEPRTVRYKPKEK